MPGFETRREERKKNDVLIIDSDMGPGPKQPGQARPRLGLTPYVKSSVKRSPLQQQHMPRSAPVVWECQGVTVRFHVGKNVHITDTVELTQNDNAHPSVVRPWIKPA